MKKLILLSLACLPIFAQQTPVYPQPDCTIAFSFTATGTSPLSPQAGFDNRQLGCQVWAFTYSVSGFSAANISLQSAPNVAGAPGTWVTFAGQTLIIGTNPNSNTSTGLVTVLTGYQPWIRIFLNSVTGSGIIPGAAYGWRNLNASQGGTAGGTTQDVNLVKVGGVSIALGQTTMSASVPVTIASDQSTVKVQGNAASGAAVSGNPNLIAGSDGTNARTAATDIKGDLSSLCTNPATYQQALFNLSGSGNTQIVAGGASQLIRICHISFTTTAPEDIKITSGTGSNCASGTADVTGLYKSVVGLAFDFLGALTGPSSANLCLNQSAVQALGGVITYVLF